MSTCVCMCPGILFLNLPSGLCFCAYVYKNYIYRYTCTEKFVFLETHICELIVNARINVYLHVVVCLCNVYAHVNAYVYAYVYVYRNLFVVTPSRRNTNNNKYRCVHVYVYV